MHLDVLAGNRVVVRAERSLPCEPEAAFRWVTDPVAMNRWSTAHVRSVRPGDGGSAAGTGALRSVDLPGLLAPRLEEVVVESRPPERFVYRVVRGAPVREHQGELRVTPAASGSHLEWTIQLTFPVGAMVHVARRTLLPELERSLDRLVDIASTAVPRGDSVPRRDLDESAELMGLFAEAERVLGEQRALAAEREAVRDPRAWFASVYAYVTEGQIDAVRRGVFAHPGWVLRLVPVFHRYYVDNLLRFERSHGAPPEAHWAKAFRASRPGPTRFEEMAQGVFQGMRAHIEEDLPRALAGVYVDHYADKGDYARFRADYLAMAPIFDVAGARLLEHVPSHEIPWRARMARMFLPRELEQRFMARGYYDIPRKRREAFERGERLASLLIERIRPTSERRRTAKKSASKRKRTAKRTPKRG
ncbi:MAG: DUF5995 family protein [Polyangiales bacterium]|nr:SRPBCC family protein [Myxococcales bacterium]